MAERTGEVKARVEEDNVITRTSPGMHRPIGGVETVWKRTPNDTTSVTISLRAQEGWRPSSLIRGFFEKLKRLQRQVREPATEAGEAGNVDQDPGVGEVAARMPRATGSGDLGARDLVRLILGGAAPTKKGKSVPVKGEGCENG